MFIGAYYTNTYHCMYVYCRISLHLISYVAMHRYLLYILPLCIQLHL